MANPPIPPIHFNHIRDTESLISDNASLRNLNITKNCRSALHQPKKPDVLPKKKSIY